MVLGFGSRSKKKSKEVKIPQAIRTSPSLPELSAQRIPWPEDLVDYEILETPLPETPIQSSIRMSFSSSLRNGAIAFHKPFKALVQQGQQQAQQGFARFTMSTDRNATIKANQNGGPRHSKESTSIAALYMTPREHPPSAFNLRGTNNTVTASRPTQQRRPRVPPTFNLMVAGAHGTGKTSLLRLLVDTADVSPGATSQQRHTMDRFLRGSHRRTERIDSAYIEIQESRFDRILLKVIDTPGLDLRHGQELKFERQISDMVKYLEAQYADTMDEEFKVVRTSKGDQHVHLCIYLIDPDSVIPVSERRIKSAFLSRSEVTLTLNKATVKPVGPAPTEVKTAATEGVGEDEAEVPTPLEDDGSRLSMSPADLNVIRRLSVRVNVLPVIAKADSLTDDKLMAVKAAIRRDLHETGLEFGVFGPATVEDSQAHSNESVDGKDVQVDEGIGSEDEDEDRQTRRVIKLRRNSRAAAPRTNSRSRVDISEARDNSIPFPPEFTDPESVASVRFSAHYFGGKTHLEELLPFAMIMPELTRRPTQSKSRPESHCSIDTSNLSMATTSEVGHATQSLRSSIGRSHSMTSPGLPKEMKGLFLRSFRWGTVDVLEPAHCDFSALRTAILSTHMTVLKTHTKEKLYEKFRTDKLVARRVTQNIGEEGHRRLLAEVDSAPTAPVTKLSMSIDHDLQRLRTRD